MKRSQQFFVVVIAGIAAIAFSMCAGPASMPPPLPVRDFLHSNEKPVQGFGAYGYLLFASRPTETDRDRYRKVCRAYLAEFEPTDAFMRYNMGSLMVTYFPVDSMIGGRAEAEDSDTLLNHYDFAAAAIIITAVNKQGIEGPLLVAFTKPFEPGMAVDNALILDMSHFEDSDIPYAFRVWRNRISRDPEGWNKGFSLEKSVLEFRNLINKYGQQIVDIFKV